MERIAERRLPIADEAMNWPLFLLVAAGLCSLNFTPVSESWLAPAVAIAVALACTGDPRMWLFYIAASQVAADPPDFPLTLAEIGVVVWLCSFPFRRSWPSLREVVPFLLYVAPCVLWYYAASLAMRQHASFGLLSGVAVGAITYSYLTRTRIRPHILLLYAIMGTSFAVLGYWGLRFGLPVISTVYDLSVAGAHIVRTGSGRGDSNSAGSNLSVLIVGTMALATFRRFWAPGPSRYLDVLWIAGSVIGLPALLFTYARSAVGAVSLGVISLLITAVLAHRSAAQSIRAVVVAVGILAGAIGIFTFVLHESPVDYVQTMKSRNEVSQAENGGGFLSGRLAVWQTHLDMLRKYPLAGVPSGTIVAVNAYESATAGTEDWYRVCAHNVFLDFGSNSGLPGLVLFTIVFFRAPIVLVRRRGLGYAGPFVVVLVAIFVAMFNYGASTWKLYWALLALMIYAAGDRQRQYRRPLVIARSGAGKPFRVAA